MVQQNLLLLFGGNTQQNADEPQDHILAVSDDGVMGAKVVLTDHKPVGKGDTICVQHIQTEEKHIIGLKLYGDG